MNKKKYLLFVATIGAAPYVIEEHQPNRIRMNFYFIERKKHFQTTTHAHLQQHNVKTTTSRLYPNCI